MQFQRVVILGASGFVGRRLVERLAVDYPGLALRAFSRAQLDLEASDAVARLRAEVTPQTAVLFCSGLTRMHGDSLALFRRNMLMTEHVCDALSQQPPACLQYLSSSAVYGEDIEQRAIDEETPINPRTYYGLSKYTSERLLLQSLGAKTQVTLLRPPALYGPGDTSRAYGPSLFLAAAAGEVPLTLWGDGSELRAFVLVDDLVTVMLRLLEHPVAGVLNPVLGPSVTFQAMLRWIETRLGHPIPRIERPRSKDKIDHCFTGERLRQLFPDLRFHTLEEGLTQCWKGHPVLSTRAPVSSLGGS